MSEAESVRTPETVLRAMRGVYEEAALEAEVAFLEDPLVPGAGQKTDRLGDHVRVLRAMLAITVFLGKTTLSENERAYHQRSLDSYLDALTLSGLREDYEARLSGARPVDASAAALEERA